MVLNFVKEFYERDKSKKTKEWADILISQFRILMQPIVDKERMIENRTYLNSNQDMEHHKKKFKSPDTLPFKFQPLDIFGKYRNILSAEREKADIYISLNSLDPSIRDDKNNDLDLFKNKNMIEANMNYVQEGMGLPPYKLSEDKGPDGKKLTKGNVDQFYDLGLNDQEADDIAYFFKTFYRLDLEIEAEQIINYFIKYGNMKELLKYWIDDVLAAKVIAGRGYIDEFTFTPTYKYVEPTNVYWIRGKKRDGSDASAKAIEENLTVNQFISMVGAEVTDELVEYMLTAVNYRNAQAYDGVDYGSYTYPRESKNPIGYSSFLNMFVGTGYIEWKSLNNSATKEGKNKLGNFRSYNIKPTSRVESINYKKVNTFTESTYKAYYIQTSSNQQILFKFGELFDMPTSGMDDEYSGYSIHTYVQPGPSAVETARPHIDTIHDMYFRIQWILNKIKPAGTRYNYNAVVKVAVAMFKNEGLTERNAVMRYIKSMEDSIDDFYVNDTANPNLGGGQNPHFEKKNGVDDALFKLYEVMKVEDAAISDKLATNAIREGYSPSPNDGYKLQMQSLAQSRNATEYISRMLMAGVLEPFAKITLQGVQDLIELYPARAKKVLTRALGEKAVEQMSSLERIPIHKFGIFVESFNTEIQREEEKRNAYQAWQNKEIEYHTYLLISSVDNWKRAAQILAYEKAKGNKTKLAEMRAAQEEIRATDTNRANLESNNIVLKGKGEIAKQQKVNEGLLEVEKLSSATEIRKKQMSIDAEYPKADARADADIKKKNAQAEIEDQQLFKRSQNT